MLQLLVYMPALNEGLTIRDVLSNVPDKFEGFQETQLLVVNDGSSDNTEVEAKIAGAQVVNHPYNRGVGAAFHTAVEYALKNHIDVLVSIDADGQFDAHQIKELIEPIKNKSADFSLGIRFENRRPKNMPKVKYWGNKQVNKIVSKVSKTKIEDASCGFRAYSRECLMSLNLQGAFTYTHETILDLLDKKFKVAQVPVTVYYFEERVSRVAHNIPQYALRTSKIILKCLKDYSPFYFFSSLALFVLLLAGIIGGFVTIHWIRTGEITPYKSFGIFALGLSGVFFILMVLALIADMLGRSRKNQERIIYLLKKAAYDKRSDR